MRIVFPFHSWCSALMTSCLGCWWRTWKPWIPAFSKGSLEQAKSRRWAPRNSCPFLGHCRAAGPEQLMPPGAVQGPAFGEVTHLAQLPVAEETKSIVGSSVQSPLNYRAGRIQGTAFWSLSRNSWKQLLLSFFVFQICLVLIFPSVERIWFYFLLYLLNFAGIK